MWCPKSRNSKATVTREQSCQEPFLIGLGQQEGQPFLVMQYIEGETLARRIARGSLQLRDALDIAARSRIWSPAFT